LRRVRTGAAVPVAGGRFKKVESSPIGRAMWVGSVGGGWGTTRHTTAVTQERFA